EMAGHSHRVLVRLLRVPPLILLAAILLTTTSFGTPTPAKPTPYPVYFVGDSLTAGRGATEPGAAYRPLLLTHLRQNPRLAIVAGGVWFGGWRVADALDAAVASPPHANTAVIVVEIGTNDASGNLMPGKFTSPSDFAVDYAQLIAYLRAEAPEAAILCLSVWRSSNQS